MKTCCHELTQTKLVWAHVKIVRPYTNQSFTTHSNAISMSCNLLAEMVPLAVGRYDHSSVMSDNQLAEIVPLHCGWRNGSGAGAAQPFQVQRLWLRLGFFRGKVSCDRLRVRNAYFLVFTYFAYLVLDTCALWKRSASAGDPDWQHWTAASEYLFLGTWVDAVNCFPCHSSPPRQLADRNRSFWGWITKNIWWVMRNLQLQSWLNL